MLNQTRTKPHENINDNTATKFPFFQNNAENYVPTKTYNKVCNISVPILFFTSLLLADNTSYTEHNYFAVMLLLFQHFNILAHRV